MNPASVKTCTRCQVEKELDAFYGLRSGKHGRTARCKECTLQLLKLNPEPFRQARWRRQYKIDFDPLWEAQKGLCASCGTGLLRDGTEPTSVCVDHDRSCCPGKSSCGSCVRGLIHRKCNLVLGYARDDVELLKSAVEYLEKGFVS